MKKFLFLLLFTPLLFAQEGMFSKNPIINKENWNKQITIGKEKKLHRSIICV
jgi:hypothetical protein